MRNVSTWLNVSINSCFHGDDPCGPRLPDRRRDQLEMTKLFVQEMMEKSVSQNSVAVAMQ